MVSRTQEALSQPAVAELPPIITSAPIEEMIDLELPSYKAIRDGERGQDLELPPSYDAAISASYF